MAIQGLEFDKPTLVDGGHEQKAIVNTANGKQPVNAPTVEDIKRIAKGIAEEEAEQEGSKSYTKAESDAKFLNKTDAASSYAAKDSVYTKTESDAKYQKKYTNTSVAILVPDSEGVNDFETTDMNNIMQLNVGDLVMVKAAFQDTGDDGTYCVGVVVRKTSGNGLLISLNMYLPVFECTIYQLSAYVPTSKVRVLTDNAQENLSEEDITLEIYK